MLLRINDGYRDWIVRAMESAGASMSLIMKVKRANGRIFLTVQEHSAIDAALNRASKRARSREGDAVAVEKEKKRRVAVVHSHTSLAAKNVDDDFEVSL